MESTAALMEKPHFNEFAAIKNHLPALGNIYGKELTRQNVQHLIGIDEQGNRSTAWRIRVNNDAETRQTKAMFDWDDTLEPYTQRKEKFYNALAVATTDDEDIQTKIKLACHALNKAARVLPFDGTHPEKYAPLLELAGVSSLLNAVKQGEIPSILTDHSSENVRSYINTSILPTLGGKVIKRDELLGKGKKYFIEKENQAVSVRFSDKPDNVAEEVWEKYKLYMTKANIPEEEFANFDLPDDIDFSVTTFGQVDFQLEKIINSLQAIKERGGRLPDEIVVISRGRKKPIIMELMRRSQARIFKYFDDSPGQLNGLRDIANLEAYHAKRLGARRATEDANVPAIPMGTTRLSEMVNN